MYPLNNCGPALMVKLVVNKTSTLFFGTKHLVMLVNISLPIGGVLPFILQMLLS
jgi:hypothetical protein